jgi:hypothetical protein
MMIRKSFWPVSLALLFIMTATLGCTETRRGAIVASPTCNMALEQGLETISDYELVELFDQTSKNYDLSGCWIPLIKRSLDENRSIPHHHLVKALQVLNQKQHETDFHKCVQRYLVNLSKGTAPYRTADRRLLEAYCSMVINKAKNARDPNLVQTRMLCQKLDHALYQKLFG